jgi:hypothetical protein
MSGAGNDFDRWAVCLACACRFILGPRSRNAKRDSYRVSAAPCPEHGPGCARVVYGILVGHFPWQGQDPERLAECLARTMLPVDPRAATPVRGH